MACSFYCKTKNVMFEIYLEHLIWGAVIQVSDINIDLVCDKNLNLARFIWKHNSLSFSHIHRIRTSLSFKLIGVVPQINLKRFFQIHKPKIHATSLNKSIIELTHFICERHGGNHSSRLFQMQPWKGCECAIGSAKSQLRGIVPVESNMLPCVQEVARVSPQLDQLGLVCNNTYGIRKHHPIGFFCGEVMEREVFYKKVSDEIIVSEREGVPCERTAYSIEYGPDHVMDCWNTRSYVSAANHACGDNANARVDYWKVGGSIFLMLVSKKEIPFNAPIVYNYGHDYIRTNNKICYGVFCNKTCNFEAQCRLLEDQSLAILTKGGEMIIPKPSKTIKEATPQPTHCHISISQSVLFAHYCFTIFFTESRNYYSWKINQ
jgi:hypothetical protein